MHKKGMSTIVATTLIILVTVAAVTMLWISLNSFLGVDVSTFQTQLYIITADGNTFYDSANDIVWIQVEAKGKNEPQFVQLIITLSNGKELISTHDAPKLNNRKTLKFRLDNYDLDPVSASVAPVYLVDDDIVLGYRTAETRIVSRDKESSYYSGRSDIYPDAESDFSTTHPELDLSILTSGGGGGGGGGGGDIGGSGSGGGATEDDCGTDSNNDGKISVCNCQVLDIPMQEYILVNDIDAIYPNSLEYGVCFVVNADGISLDFDGYTVFSDYYTPPFSMSMFSFGPDYQGSAIYVNESDSFDTFDGLIDYYDIGIYYYLSNDNTVNDLSFTNVTGIISLIESNDSIFEDIISNNDNAEVGSFSFISSYRNQIRNVNGDTTTFSLELSDENIIENIYIENSNEANSLTLQNSNENVINGFTSSESGISLSRSDLNSFNNIDVSQSDIEGINLWRSNNNSFYNVISSENQRGVDMETSHFNYFENINLNLNQYYGMEIVASENNFVKDSVFTKTSAGSSYGLRLNSALGSTLNNTLLNTTYSNSLSLFGSSPKELIVQKYYAAHLEQSGSPLSGIDVNIDSSFLEYEDYTLTTDVNGNTNIVPVTRFVQYNGANNYNLFNVEVTEPGYEHFEPYDGQTTFIDNLVYDNIYYS